MSDLFPTQDGSVTRFHEETGELYHNTAGAFTEALETYVIPSAAVEKFLARGSLNVLDACFGLGYNTFALIEKLIEAGAGGTLNVVAVELHAHTFADTNQVLQTSHLSGVRAMFGQDLSLNFGKRNFEFHDLRVQFQLLHADLRKFVPDCRDNFDLVFHDPFTARKVPHLWTIDMFREYYRLLAPRDGELVTYSCSRAVRGALMQCGFTLFQTLASPRKGGGTLATVSRSPEPRAGARKLSDEELQKFAGKAGIPYRDDNFALSEDQIYQARLDEQSSHPGRID